MFLENKYTKWYFSIINKALSEHRVKGDTRYYEMHHIHPRSMGGTNQKSNLVLLTAKEHFVCHWLLTKMVHVTKHQYQMHNAFACFLRKNERQKRSFSSFEYQKAREAAWKARGRKKPEGFGERIRLALTGSKLSEGRKKKISMAHKGKKHAPEVVQKRADTNRNSWTSDKKKKAGGIAVVINGIDYPSIKTACKLLGLNRKTIQRILRENNNVISPERFRLLMERSSTHR